MYKDDELASLLELDIEGSLLDDIRLGRYHDDVCMRLWTCLDLVPESLADGYFLCSHIGVVYEKVEAWQKFLDFSFFLITIGKIFLNIMLLPRRHTYTVMVGHVPFGSDHPIVVQSMTNTPTRDIDATVAQIIELARAGSEIVRITIDTDAAAMAVPEIISRLR